MIKQIKELTHTPMVLHGGSGLRDEDFTNAIRAGVRIVHINSEIRLAYRDALRDTLASLPEEITPAKLCTPAITAVEAVVSARLQLFNTP